LTLEERVEEVVEEFGSRLDWDRDFMTCIWLFIFYSSNIYLSLKKFDILVLNVCYGQFSQIID
jgi:leucyl-tRNA synthetase